MGAQNPAPPHPSLYPITSFPLSHHIYPFIPPHLSLYPTTSFPLSHHIYRPPLLMFPLNFPPFHEIFKKTFNNKVSVFVPYFFFSSYSSGVSCFFFNFFHIFFLPTLLPPPSFSLGLRWFCWNKCLKFLCSELYEKSIRCWLGSILYPLLGEE